MKHLKKKGRKFGRKIDQRKALLKHLINNLILQERIKTTLAKAKEAQKKIERLITIAKKQNLSALRRLSKDLSSKASKKLYSELAIRYAEIKSGYSRIVKITKRKIKSAVPLVILELIKREEYEKEKREK